MICLGFVLACTVAQLYRYRYVSTAIQRQQTKWIMFDMLLGTFVDAANLLPLPGGRRGGCLPDHAGSAK